MRNAVRFVAAAFVVFGFVRCEDGFALADGYYDTTWLGTGRTRFQGDEIGDDANFPPNVSGVGRVFVQANGDLLLAGAAYIHDTWFGAMHSDGSWILTFGLSNGFGRTTLCYVATCDGFQSAVFQTSAEWWVLGSGSVAHLNAPVSAWYVQALSTTVTIDNVSGYVAAQAIAVQTDGKVLLGGVGYVSQADTVPKFGIARLLSSLSNDASFNNTTVGDVVYSGGAAIAVSGTDTSEKVTDVLVQPDGRIILVGYGIANTAMVLELTRLSSEGSPDATFGSGGSASFAWPSGAITALGKAKLDRAGRILVPISGTPPSQSGIAVVARVTADGQLDGNFGQDAGFARFSLSGTCQTIEPNALDIDSAGRILVAGKCTTVSFANYFIVARLRGDTGYLDGSFGISGYGLGAYADGRTGENGRDIAFDSSGRPIVAGDSDGEAGIARLTYDLIYTNNFELTPRGCLPPNCN